MRKALLTALICGLFALRAAAADPYQVFLTSGSQLSFINLMTGDNNVIAVNGSQFTVLRDAAAVMFYDRTQGRVRIATPGGRVLEHPFIHPGAEANRVDWMISHDEATIAWTETSGAPSALTTTTWIAGIDGADMRPVFTDGPRNGIRAFPVAFNEDKSVLYMDYQPDTIGDLTPFRQYAALFSLDLISGETNSLPGEPGCFCGATIGAGMFLRLTLAESGFNLRILNLTSGTATTLPPVNDYTQGGDVLIAPDGSQAVYALAQISGFGTAGQTVQSVIVLVDLLSLAQQPIPAPEGRLLRPLAWTEDDSAILFADAVEGTTWKVSVRSGELEKVANGVYLGTLTGGA